MPAFFPCIFKKICLLKRRQERETQRRQEDKERDSLSYRLVALDTSQLEISMLNAEAKLNTSRQQKTKKKGRKKERESPDRRRSFIFKEDDKTED